MKPIFYGIIVLGALLIYEAVKGLKAPAANASAAPVTGSTPANTAAVPAAEGNGQALNPQELASVLNIAEQQTGVGPSWDAGLRAVLAQENAQLNPAAVNPTPALPGQNATGLFQVIPSTFQASAAPNCTDPLNPVCSAIAAINHIRAAWGTPAAITGLGTPAYGGY